MDVQAGKIVMTLAVASAGGFIGYKLKIPAGVMIGAMLATAMYNVGFGCAFLPKKISVIMQVVAGALIGVSFTRETLATLKTVALPLVLAVASLLLFSVILGVIIHKITGINAMTAFFSTCPGGLTDMIILSTAYENVDARIVAVFHTVRLTSVIIFIPIIARFVSKIIK